MSHGVDIGPAKTVALPDNRLLAGIAMVLARLNTGLMRLSMGALIVTSLILTYSVVSRYFFRQPTDWQDEASVFLLVGVTFFCTAWVQGQRGHIGIEALSSILPARVNAVRLFLVDLISGAFCAFFAWKSWAMFHEAWVDGMTTSSTFGPPLWIPYGMMAAGMSLLALQILVQVFTHVVGTAGPAPGTDRNRA